MIGYWKYSFESQNQGDEKSNLTVVENSKILNQEEYKKVEYLLQLLGFDLSKVDKVVGYENKEWKKSFEVCGKQIFGKQKATPDKFKKEDWIKKSIPELRKSFVQYLGDYITKFREVGWNHGNNVNSLSFLSFCILFFFFLNFFLNILVICYSNDSRNR